MNALNTHYKNILFILQKYFSMESVDQVGRRERFMQSNFESLSGGDDASLPTMGSATNSISNAWREGGAGSGQNSAHQRNAGTIGKVLRNIWQEIFRKLKNILSFRCSTTTAWCGTKPSERRVTAENWGNENETSKCKNVFAKLWVFPDEVLPFLAPSKQPFCVYSSKPKCTFSRNPSKRTGSFYVQYQNLKACRAMNLNWSESTNIKPCRPRWKYSCPLSSIRSSIILMCRAQIQYWRLSCPSFYFKWPSFILNTPPRFEPNGWKYQFEDKMELIWFNILWHF